MKFDDTIRDLTRRFGVTPEKWPSTRPDPLPEKSGHRDVFGIWHEGPRYKCDDVVCELARRMR